MRLRAIAVLTLSATMLLVPGGPPVVAAAPSNDTWQTASEVMSLPFSAEVDLGSATIDADEVAVASACGQVASPGIWFSYTPRSAYQQRIVSPAQRITSAPGGTIVRMAQNGALEPLSCAGSSRTVLLESGATYFVMFSRGTSVSLLDVTCFPEPGDPAATGSPPPCPPSVVGVPAVSVAGKRRAGTVELRFRNSFTTFFPDTLALTQGDMISDGPEAGDRFGAVVTQGLVDGDDLTDVVIGVPDEDVRGRRDAGAVHVVFGAPEGLGRGRPSLLLDQHRSALLFPDSTRDSADGPAPGDRFGSALAVSSSHHILAVGVPGEDIAGRRNAGSVTLYRFEGVTEPPAERVIAQGAALAGRIESGNRVGSAVAWTVQPQEGRPTAPGLNLAIGAPGDDVAGQADAGSVLTWSEWSGRTQRISQASSGIADRPEKNDRFGASIATADLAFADGVAVAVGVPGEDRGRLADAGQIAFLSGEHAGRGMQGCAIAVPRRLPDGRSLQPGDRLGSVLALRRIDAVPTSGVPGSTQLLAGLPDRTVEGRRKAGALYVADIPHTCARSRLGSAELITQASPGVPGRAEEGDRFAAAVSTVPLPRHSNIREEGYYVTDTVIAGAPREDLARKHETGVVHQVLPTGPAVVGPGGVATEDARFGSSLG